MTASEPEPSPGHIGTRYAQGILIGLNKLSKHVYGGTVSVEAKARRRAKGKRARQSRRVNR